MPDQARSLGAPPGPATRTAPPPAATRPAAPAGGVWPGRPAGLPATVPPPSVPLSYLACASAGLLACGATLVWAAASHVVDPTAGRMVAAAHLGVLATLTTGVLGALHQFVPVITNRPLRSVPLSRATMVAWVATAWLIPLGVVTRVESLVLAGGATATVAVVLLIVNLWPPLSARVPGIPVVGLRLAVTGFALTACYGVVFVTDRSGRWFDLAGHVVLAHAVVGIFAWLGLAYISVAEKLWPMFLLSHVPGHHRAGWVAVVAVPAGVVLLSPGLLLGPPAVAVAGGAIVAVGLAAHLVSLAQTVKHRRRKVDLHLVFITTAAVWLVAGGALAVAGALVMPRHHHTGVLLVAAAVAALAGWLLEALVGHAHKVVPFIVWSALRGRGVDRTPSGRAILFGDLYHHGWAAVAYVLVTVGAAEVVLGFAASQAAELAIGGVLLALVGVIVPVNLSVAPLRLLAGHARSQREERAPTA